MLTLDNYQELTKNISVMLGLKQNFYPMYRCELIHLKNDGFKDIEIAKMLGVERSTVNKWLTKYSQPRAEIIKKLEDKFMHRVGMSELVSELYMPTRHKI